MTMASPGTPAETRAYILERLVGETGEPDRVIEAARAMAERAVPVLAQNLRNATGRPAEIEIDAVELTRFGAVRPQETAGTAMTIAASATSPDALVLTIDPMAASLLVDMMFGGDPDLPAQPIARDLSPIEAEMAAMAFEQVAKSLNGSGTRSLDVRFPLPAPLTGGEIRKQALRDGPAVRVAFALICPNGRGSLSIAMPQRVLLKHRGDAVAAAAKAEPGRDEWGARFGEEVMRSAVTLEATMPLGKLTLGEIAWLHEGQVIELQPDAQSRATLTARNRTLFTCEFGRLGQNYTVRISGAYDTDQDILAGLLPT